MRKIYLHLAGGMSILSLMTQSAPALADLTPKVASTSKTSLLSPIARPQEQENTDSDDPMAQVTSVSQLRDVQPTDWAFQAL